MTIYQEKDYLNYMERGNMLLNYAEELYEEKRFGGAVQKYYSASICFEFAKEIAILACDVGLKLNANQKEFYCLEKIDELQQFKNVSIDEMTK